MNVKEKTFQQLLSYKETLTVPAFQRRYAWKRRNFSQLWEGINEVIDETRKRHFMGTVVFQQDGDFQLTVIDGQQRLITFTVVLKALHDLSIEHSPSQTLAISKLLLHKGRQFLEPSVNDSESMTRLLCNPHRLKKVEDREFRECYEFFVEHIGAYVESSKGQKGTNFSRVYHAIVEKMVFVEILLSDDDDAHAIFETINYSGVPLTAADLARNFVLSQEKDQKEQRRLNEQYWAVLEKELAESVTGNSKAVRKAEIQKILPEFLRAVLVVEVGKYVSATDLFPALRRYFQGKDLEDKLSILLVHAKEYCKFIQPELETRKRVQQQLLRLLDLKMTTYNPLLLVLFRASKNDGFKAADLVHAMRYIESFIVRRAFNSKVSRDLPKTFAYVAVQLALEKRGDRLLRHLIKLLVEKDWPTDKDFTPCFLSTPIYKNARETARFALLSLERLGSNGHEVKTDKSIQIEHVFPQRPNPIEWDQKDLPGLMAKLHVMGNLTLTGYNPKLSNSGFLKKKSSKGGYSRSPYWLNKMFRKIKNWTGADVDKRGKLLLTQALKLWPFPQ